MARLSWISDAVLEKAVSRFLQRAQEAVDSSADRMAKNRVDPFSSLVMATTMQTGASLSSLQRIASASSGISSAVGAFHQEILGSVHGCSNHDAGYDIECSGKKILAEIKNKHNTMNAVSRKQTIEDLDTAVRQKAGNWTAYLVLVIPKKPGKYRKKLTKREVYETDGASFYELVTGSEDALHDLYHAVEAVVEEKSEPHKISEPIKRYCRTALKGGVPQ